MSEIFQSPHFGMLPAREDIVDKIEQAGLGIVKGIELFPFSSCTPVFQVDLNASNGSGADKIVLRGEQQNDLLVMSAEERSIEKEIWMLNRIRSLGLNAPKVFLENQVLSTPAYDSVGNPCGEFRFFLMEFTGGKAMDRVFKEAGERERLRLLDRIAGIYARIHSVEGEEYGVTDGTGRAVFGENDLEEFLHKRSDRLCGILTDLGEKELVGHVHKFVGREAASLCDGLRASGYVSTPRLCLIDGFCGNMLMDGERINLIDMAMGGYFDPITEFCAFVYPLRDLLLEKTNESNYWEFFLAAYQAHGGNLPLLPLLARMLRFMFVHVLIQQLIYWKESPAIVQQSKARKLAGKLPEFMGASIKGLQDVVKVL